ncbi:hypothetical protein TrLO_g14411 [Triparma laevis f. longispina]|nr:hypothetical protein TrLO_g14411 [Triparma laevis f. longispina]
MHLKKSTQNPTFCLPCKSILKNGGKFWSREMFNVEIEENNSIIKLSKPNDLKLLKHSNATSPLKNGDCLNNNDFCVTLPSGGSSSDELFNFKLTSIESENSNYVVDLTSPTSTTIAENTQFKVKKDVEKDVINLHLIPRGKLSSKRIDILLKSINQYQTSKSEFAFHILSKTEILNSPKTTNILIIDKTLKLPSLLSYFSSNFPTLLILFKEINIKVIGVEWLEGVLKGRGGRWEEYGWREWREGKKKRDDGSQDSSDTRSEMSPPSPKEWITKKRSDPTPPFSMPPIKVRKASTIDNPVVNSVKDYFELDEFQLEVGDVDLVLLRARRSGAISLIKEEETTTTRTAGAIDKIPNCECLGIPRLATLRTCDMRGPYHGLQFYACEKTVGEGCCNLFLWKGKNATSAKYENSSIGLESDNDVISSQESGKMEEGRDTPLPQSQGTNEEIRKTTERKDMNPDKFAFSDTSKKLTEALDRGQQDDFDHGQEGDLHPPPNKPTAGHNLHAINIKVADFLNKLSKAHSVGNSAIKRDKFRIYTYKKAASRVRTWPEPLDLNTPDVFDRLSACKGPPGANTIMKIKEVLGTGSCGRLEEVEGDEWRKSINEVGKIWGVGPDTSIVFVNMGFNTVDKIRQAVDRRDPNIALTAQQEIGLQLYDDLLTPCPRSEITSIADRVRKTVQRIYPSTVLDIMGSYRRGAVSGHDVDCLLTCPDFKEKLPRGCLMKIIQELTKEGVLTDHLSMPSEKASNSLRLTRRKSPAFDKSEIAPEAEAPIAHLTYSYMGVIKIGKHHRRIDIKFYPWEQKPFAQLYFTGNAYFNRSMRLYAKMIGYSLSDHGLCKTSRKKIEGKWYVTAKQASLVAKTEKDVFGLLGLKWVEPQDRNAYDAVAEAKMEEPDEVGEEELSQGGSDFCEESGESFVEKFQSQG